MPKFSLECWFLTNQTNVNCKASQKFHILAVCSPYTLPHLFSIWNKKDVLLQRYHMMPQLFFLV